MTVFFYRWDNRTDTAATPAPDMDESAVHDGVKPFKCSVRHCVWDFRLKSQHIHNTLDNHWSSWITAAAAVLPSRGSGPVSGLLLRHQLHSSLQLAASIPAGQAASSFQRRRRGLTLIGPTAMVDLARSSESRANQDKKGLREKLYDFGRNCTTTEHTQRSTENGCQTGKNDWCCSEPVLPPAKSDTIKPLHRSYARSEAPNRNLKPDKVKADFKVYLYLLHTEQVIPLTSYCP